MGMVQIIPAMNRVETPVCSICIANFNGVNLLVDCIDSIIGQQGGITTEIIVHDDASTDGSVDFLRTNYPQIEIMASDSNVGFCISNNRMAAHARGEFILLLNNDATLFPDALSTLLGMARMQAAPGILSLPQFDWLTGALVDRGCLLDPFYNPVPNLEPDRAEVAMVIGACFFIQRALWGTFNGFPEWFESIGEDLYVCCLARLRGLPVKVASSSGYRHRQGASFGGNRASGGQLQSTYRRRRLSERNKTAALIICTPTPLAWPLLALHLFGLAMEGAILSLARRDLALWRNVYGATIKWALGSSAKFREHRRQAQAQRRIGLLGYLSEFTWVPQKIRLLARHGIPKIT